MSYWKFNNSLLKNPEYVYEIKEVIKETKLQYVDQELNTYNDINDVPLNEIRLTINDQLFFEMLLLAIRGKTIAYSSHQKKLNADRESQLLKEIEKLEKEENIQYGILDLKKRTFRTKGEKNGRDMCSFKSKMDTGR